MKEIEEICSNYKILNTKGDADSYKIDISKDIDPSSDVIVLLRNGVKPQDYLALLKQITSMLRSDFKANERGKHMAAVRNEIKEFQEAWA